MKKYGEDELSTIWELVDVELQKATANLNAILLKNAISA